MVKYEDLLGLPYIEGVNDCFELMRKFYDLNYGIKMADYARPGLWWAKAPELDFLRKHLAENKFVPYDQTPHNMKEGDGLLFQVGGSVVNHCGAYLGGGRFLHHPFRGTSQVSLLFGLWSSRLMVTCRHTEIVSVDLRATIQMIDLLSPQKKALYLASIPAREGGTDPT